MAVAIEAGAMLSALAVAFWASSRALRDNRNIERVKISIEVVGSANHRPGDSKRAVPPDEPKAQP